VKSKRHVITIDKLMSDGQWRSRDIIVSNLIDLPVIRNAKGLHESQRSKRRMIPTKDEISWYLRKNNKYETRKEKVREWRMMDTQYTE
tara:strand:- start:2932 stop:3195 length:264 start_codon:yes stop_codon:yes gene_type:complete